MKLFHSHGTAITAIFIEIVLSFVPVMAQLGKIDCLDGCKKPLTNPQVSFVIAKNDNNVQRPTTSSCFPINTELLYVCREPETYQIAPLFTRKDLFIKCINNEWRSEGNLPNCVKREKHCRSPAPLGNRDQNFIVEIEGKNINIKNNNKLLLYSVDTMATLKCKDSKPNAMEDRQQFLRCTKDPWSMWKWQANYEWKLIQPREKDLVCDDNALSTEISIQNGDRVSSESTPAPSNLDTPTTSKETQSGKYDLPNKISIDGNDRLLTESVTTVSFKDIIPSKEAQKNHDNVPSTSDSNISQMRFNLLIGICSSLSFVLIVVLLGVLYKNRTSLSKRYNNSITYHARQSSFNSTPEEKNKLEENCAAGEENLAYVNIIPIKVNQETIYTEVEAGTIGKSVPTTKRNIGDDQVSNTIYAEIQHSVIPKEQRQ